MKKQIIVIHGGDAFETYDEYISYLQNRSFSLDRLRAKDWKQNLGAALGGVDGEFDVLHPQMPNSQNARYLEWKIWFERLVPLFDDEVIFIGHSLGGIFLAKYVSEHLYPKQIRSLHLVAAPYNTAEIHPLVDFNLTAGFNKLVEQVSTIHLYHSSDDQVVPYDNLAMYEKAFQDAGAKQDQVIVHRFTNRQHFNQDTFVELVDVVSSGGTK